MSEYRAVESVLNKVKAALINDQLQKGIRASGASAASLEVVENKLLGSESWYYQIFGRKPGSFPNIEAILEWIQIKRITATPIENKDGTFRQVSEKSLAFLIARKIAQKGTDIYMGKRPGIDISSQMEQIRKEFIDEYGTEFKAVLVDRIRQTLTKYKK